ncbi:MAG: M23 family metallopeptidase [Sulfitobacter sp.]
MIRAAIAAMIVSFASPALAEDFLLHLPVDCTLGDTCYIQQYMDHDDSEGFSDYQCRPLSYDGHKGTDFAVPTRADMEIGVDVLAAADGRVRAYRDGMSDGGYSKATADAIEGRECGNGVVLVHPGGWETQYCHLKNGSVTTRNNQEVKAGDVLGQIGQSGRAEFPHLHLSVRKDGKKIDPFDPDGTITCNTPGDSTLWAKTPAYQPGGVIHLGIASEIPAYKDVKAGSAAADILPSDAPAMVVFGFTFGTLKDDVLRLTLSGPDGEVLQQEKQFERNHAQAFRAIGKRSRRGWTPGAYQGTVELLREGEVISTQITKVTVTPKQ